MSRKEVNRYYPPGVDPSKVSFSTKKKKGSKVQSVRLMAPFSMKCLNCNEYIAQSRKFNARKETTGRDYLGIKIIEFEVRCPRCYAELVFETDPKNGDYACVKGCKKNYERPKEIQPNETVDQMIARLDKELKEEERMKELEKKGGGNIKNGMLGEETAVEQLEKRLIEQQREKERVEELEILHEKLDDLDTRRAHLEGAIVKDEESANKSAAMDGELDRMAQEAFKSHKKALLIEDKESKKADIAVNVGGYSDSDEEAIEDDTVNEFLQAPTIKRKNETSVAGVIKKKKLKVIR
jgi:hypothetical protein